LQCDWLRAVSPYFWVYELYPDWGAWHPKVRTGDYKLKVLAPLAAGAKGIVYWQYRAERVGMENNLSGLVNIDGSSKEVSREALKISCFIRENQDFLLRAKVKTDPIAIVYSVDSDLINRVENTGSEGSWDFSLRNRNGLYLYKKALCGIYALFRELGYAVEWLDSRSLTDKAKQFKLLYLPEMFMPTAAEVTALLTFANTGGKLIAEEGLGLRRANTWVNNAWPAEPFRRLFDVKIVERECAEFNKEVLECGKFSLKLTNDNFVSRLQTRNGNIFARWSDGSPAAVQSESGIFLGTSLGALFHDSWETQYPDCRKMLAELLEKSGIAAKAKLPRWIYRRELCTDDAVMTFIFNRGQDSTEIDLPELDSASRLYGEMTYSAGKLQLAAMETGIFYNKQPSTLKRRKNSHECNEKPFKKESRNECKMQTIYTY
jgi:hypothetical protein